VYELASNGSLYQFLKERDQHENLHWTMRIRIALDVARALEYLHGGKGGQVCFHRDVKSSNVCLKRDFTALLIDCGVARMTPQADSSLTMTIMESAGNGFRGTPGYICPAFARRLRNYGSAHEVFSLGVVMVELFTGLLQNEELDGEELDVFDQFSEDGIEKMNLLSAIDKSAGQWDIETKNLFTHLALGCIRANPRSRPKINEIVNMLGKLACKARPWSVGERNQITVLSSAPLVYSDSKDLHPISELPNFRLERDVLSKCVKESRRNIQLTFDVATDDRLLAAATKRCGCLHFSGHGHPEALLFEDSSGGALWLSEEHILDCVHEEPFTFAFVSACYSLFMGKAFVKSGVKHVVCCEQQELRDDAALKFTYIFYLALAEGYSVKSSFEKGKHAVATRFGQIEVNKFVLLPEEGVDHDVPLFDADILHWGDEVETFGFVPSGPCRFQGREVEQYNLLNMILSKRLVNLVSHNRSDRRMMATTVCHYIEERKNVIMSVDVIYFLQGNGDEPDIHSEHIKQLHRHLASEGKIGAHPADDANCDDTVLRHVVGALEGINALIIFDYPTCIREITDQTFMASILNETATKLVCISQKEIDFSQIGMKASIFSM